MRLHRKIWEFCFIAQALDERGMLARGRRGLGFAVGTEPLPAMFANRGCAIVATDLATADAHPDWIATNQHAESLDVLNTRGLCPDADFRKRVQFRFADMREIPADLENFDFIWSSCSLEHLGTMDLGRKFIFDSLRCLKPGGVAVHTTEYNVSSNTDTVTDGYSVLFRQRDIEEIARALTADGHAISVDFSLGDGEYDRFVSKPPYIEDHILRLELEGYVATSIALVIRKKGRQDYWKSWARSASPRDARGC